MVNDERQRLEKGGSKRSSGQLNLFAYINKPSRVNLANETPGEFKTQNNVSAIIVSGLRPPFYYQATAGFSS